jgi:hypothetical protein
MLFDAVTTRHSLLAKMLECVHDGTGFVLVGPPGVGKTYLLNHFKVANEGMFQIEFWDASSIQPKQDPPTPKAQGRLLLVDSLDEYHNESLTLGATLRNCISSGWILGVASRLDVSEYDSETSSILARLETIYVGPLSTQESISLLTSVRPQLDFGLATQVASASGFIPGIITRVAQYLPDNASAHDTIQAAKDIAHQITAEDDDLSWVERPDALAEF